MDEWQKRALQVLALASALGALPGGAMLIAYSIWNDFFPTLIETVSVPQLVFISVVVAFIVFAGLGLGMGLTYWLVWLATRALPKGRRRHIFLPPERSIRLGGVILSFGMFVLILGTCLVAGGAGHDDPLYLLAYFCLSSLFIAWIVNPADGRAESSLRLLPIAATIPFALLLALHQSVVPLLDICMTTMGFRSAPTDLVLVDEDAFQRVQAMVGPVTGDPEPCAVAIGSRTFWHLKQATIVWTGVGADTLISTGHRGLPPLRLDPDQVMVLPAWRVRAGALLPDCEARPAILRSHAA